MTQLNGVKPYSSGYLPKVLCLLNSWKGERQPHIKQECTKTQIHNVQGHNTLLWYPSICNFICCAVLVLKSVHGIFSVITIYRWLLNAPHADSLCLWLLTQTSQAVDCHEKWEKIFFYYKHMFWLHFKE